MWRLDPESAPSYGVVKRELAEFPGSGRGVHGSHPEAYNADLERRAIFGAFTVLCEVAEGDRSLPSTARLIKEGQATEAVRVVLATESAITGDGQAVHEPSGTVACPFWREVGLPFLRTLNGVDLPPFGPNEAWAWADQSEAANVEANEIAEGEPG